MARHELETAGKAVGLKIEAEHTNWKADGMDLQYVKVYAVDSKGRRVYTASPAEVHFKVAGAAKLIAVDNGDQFSNELFDGGHRQLYNGFALAILRSGQRPGQVSIKVSADGLKPAEKKFITK